VCSGSCGTGNGSCEGCGLWQPWWSAATTPYLHSRAPALAILGGPCLKEVVLVRSEYLRAQYTQKSGYSTFSCSRRYLPIIPQALRGQNKGHSFWSLQSPLPCLTLLQFTTESRRKLLEHFHQDSDSLLAHIPKHNMARCTPVRPQHIT
jgi:hypothetical protein